eukprot:1949737-Rhodomonas_salina.2
MLTSSRLRESTRTHPLRNQRQHIPVPVHFVRPLWVVAFDRAARTRPQPSAPALLLTLSGPSPAAPQPMPSFSSWNGAPTSPHSP